MPRIWRNARAVALLLALALASLWAVALGPDGLAIQATVTPQPTVPPPPTNPPPTNPPPPTVPPTKPPTIPPTIPPTVPPTKPPTVPPTKPPTVPPTKPPTATATAVPTEEPSPTPTATPSPTPTPTQTPAPQPTNPPAPPRQQPRQPTPTPDDSPISCELERNAELPLPGGTEWTLHACTLPLDFGAVESIDLRATTSTPGWSIILVDPENADTPGLLDASNNRLDLDDLEDEREARFLIGVRLGCSALRTAELEVEIRATRPGESRAAIESTAAVDLHARSATAPVVMLSTADLATSGDLQSGALTIDYRNAPSTCAWQVLVTLDNQETGLPPAAIAIDTLEAPEGAYGTLTASGISIMIPASADGPDEGTIRIETTLATGDHPVDAVIVEAFVFP